MITKKKREDEDLLELQCEYVVAVASFFYFLCLHIPSRNYENTFAIVTMINVNIRGEEKKKDFFFQLTAHCETHMLIYTKLKTVYTQKKRQMNS